MVSPQRPSLTILLPLCASRFVQSLCHMLIDIYIHTRICVRIYIGDWHYVYYLRSVNAIDRFAGKELNLLWQFPAVISVIIIIISITNWICMRLDEAMMAPGSDASLSTGDGVDDAGAPPSPSPPPRCNNLWQYRNMLYGSMGGLPLWLVCRASVYSCSITETPTTCALLMNMNIYIFIHLL